MISWEYIAGFFDGEGYVGEIFHNRGLAYRLSISNNNFDVLSKIQEFVGYGQAIQVGKTSMGRPTYVYLVQDAFGVASFLSSVLPYLIVKRERAEQVLESALDHRTSVRWLTPEQRTLIDNRQVIAREAAQEIGCSVVRIQRFRNKRNKGWTWPS